MRDFGLCNMWVCKEVAVGDISAADGSAMQMLREDCGEVTRLKFCEEGACAANKCATPEETGAPDARLSRQQPDVGDR